MKTINDYADEWFAPLPMEKDAFKDGFRKGVEACIEQFWSYSGHAEGITEHFKKLLNEKQPKGKEDE